jgi:type IV secretory pathway VirB4 component
LESFDFNEAFTKGKITFIRTAEIVSNPVENRNSDKLLWSLLFEPIAKAIVGLSSKVKHILALDEIRWALADEEEYGEFIEIPLSQARSAGISFVIANQPHSSIEKINCGEKYSANMQTKINFPKMT